MPDDLERIRRDLEKLSGTVERLDHVVNGKPGDFESTKHSLQGVVDTLKIQIERFKADFEQAAKDRKRWGDIFLTAIVSGLGAWVLARVMGGG